MSKGRISRLQHQQHDRPAKRHTLFHFMQSSICADGQCFVLSSCSECTQQSAATDAMVNCSVISRQLEEVDKELEVHRETERVLHEKVTNGSSDFRTVTAAEMCL